MLFTREEGGAVRCDGRDSLTEAEALRFLNGAVRRRLRKNGHVESFVRRLAAYDEAELMWNFVKRIRDRDDHWVSIKGWRAGGSVYLFCVGPQADEAADKANSFDRRSYWASAGVTAKRPKTLSKRRRGRQRRGRQRANVKPPPRKRERQSRKTFIPAPISLERNEKLTPQFRKNRILWSEALDATVAIFETKGNGKHTARQLAARELYGSLERSGYRFAQYKRRGFVLRVDLIDGVWRGDITSLAISCTKDNRHPSYRKMRTHFGGLLVGLPKGEQDKRRLRLASSILRLVA